MRIVLKLTKIQPSSTTLRYGIEVDGLTEDDKRFLEKLAEIAGFTVHFYDDNTVYVHTSSESSIFPSLAILYALRMAKRVSAGEGDMFRPEVGLVSELAVYDKNPGTYLIIADPQIGCNIQCPWCYARPSPVDTRLINPATGGVTSGWAGIVEELAKHVSDAVEGLVKRHENGLPPHISIVVGGSTDPTLVPEIYYSIHSHVGDTGVFIAYSFTTSNPVRLLTMFDEVRKIVEMGTYRGEIVVTALDRSMAARHPLFRTSLPMYYDALYELAKKGTTLAYIVHQDAETDSLSMAFARARKVFLLHYHPAVRLWKPPPRWKIVSVMEELVIGHGIPIDRINVDACTAIKLGFPADDINMMETEAMIYCTPRGCRHAMICPRKSLKCIVRGR